MTASSRIILITLLLSMVLACGGGGCSGSNNGGPGNNGGGNGSPTTDPTALTAPGDTRDWLTKDALETSVYPHTSPIHNGYFMPVGEHAEALHGFSGTLSLSSDELMGNFAEYYISGDESFKRFPSVDLSFVSHNGYLVPMNRDRQVSLDDNSFWGVLLDPGRVWSEPSDDGWSRASFPISFISARRNQVHNAVATFLYNDNQVSHLRVQAVQETASWFRRDFYGQLEVSYTPRTFTDQDAITSAFALELQNTATIHDWQALSNIGDEASCSQFNSGLADESISQTALIKDGEVYLQGCFTRYGPYPYCRWMRNGAYSVTKSIGAAFTLFRLAQIYGEHVFDLQIADYVDVTASHNGWDTVTFGDVLNMTTGTGDNGGVSGSGDIFADENGAKMERWIAVDDERGKLAISFSYGNYVWGPGEVFRYNSAMYFVLAAALDNYYKSIEGEDADVWQWVIEDVYHPIGIQHVPMLRTIESNGEFGIAEMFHGLYPNIDDLAKLSDLILNDGMHAGVQLLHRQRLREALFKTDIQGFHSWWEDNQYGQSRYLHGFWTGIRRIKRIPDLCNRS